MSKVYERKLLSSLARAVADGRDFVDIGSLGRRPDQLKRLVELGGRYNMIMLW